MISGKKHVLNIAYLFFLKILWHDRLDHPGSVMMRENNKTIMWAYFEEPEASSKLRKLFVLLVHKED
ncbi:hypothetical protein OSB04_020218 [Centaurea solstitialis]|uniref:Uncharacterized protein n=1 Tax=Centaurea solstitialis TaxID=347529 RepID=A0AA38T3Z4_9ASTR|nr:hypothetical protein OSB04_020218 [Centaurea solstitialis]